MSHVHIKPGDRVLSLACATGLEIDIAAPQVGPQGFVVGINVTKQMLALARQKVASQPSLINRIRLIEHDVTDLTVCEDIEKGTFDWIICSNAFVLFDDPKAVVRLWEQYLRPGGKLAIDITHEHNLRQGYVLERVARRLGIKFPCDRSWITSRNSFKDILEGEGLVVKAIEELEREANAVDRSYNLSDADEQFDYIMKSPWSDDLRKDDDLSKARSLFVEEWKATAVNGKVRVTNNVYVYIAERKA